jgi:hypothetical protein
MTREEIIADLREKNPLMKSGNDTDGYVEFTPAEYEAQIIEWADWVEADIKAKTEADKAAIKAEADKAALLLKLGITADEAKLLLS